MKTLGFYFDDKISIHTGKVRIGILQMLNSYHKESELFSIVTNSKHMKDIVPFSNIDVDYYTSEYIVPLSDTVIFVWDGSNNKTYSVLMDALDRNKNPKVINPTTGKMNDFLVKIPVH